jgi:hypothetical protein
MMGYMDQDQDAGGYTGPERLLAVAGLLLGGFLLLLCADVASGGRLTGRGCGCRDQDQGEPSGVIADQGR